MKTKELIKALQDKDPTGELEVLFWDHDYEVYYDDVGDVKVGEAIKKTVGGRTKFWDTPEPVRSGEYTVEKSSR